MVADADVFSRRHEHELTETIPADEAALTFWRARNHSGTFISFAADEQMQRLQAGAVEMGPKRLKRASSGLFMDEGEWDGDLFDELARSLCPALNANWTPIESLECTRDRISSEGSALAFEEGGSTGWVAVPQGRRGVFLVSADGWRHRLVPTLSEATAFARERPYRFSLCAPETPVVARHEHQVAAHGIRI